MMKLIKYEVRKQIFSKVLFMSLLFILELLFLFAMFIRNEDIMRFSNTVLLLVAVFGMLYLLIEPATVLSSDLGKKQGYLLFMTPSSMAQIVGAKIISGTVHVMLFFSFIIGLISINEFLLSWYFNTNVDMLSEVFDAFGDVGFSFGEFVVTALTLSLITIDIISLAFFAICISYSFLVKGKMNSFISILLFIILFLVESAFVCTVFVMPFDGAGTAIVSFIVLSNLLFVIPSIINYYGSVKLLERRISI